MGTLTIQPNSKDTSIVHILGHDDYPPTNRSYTSDNDGLLYVGSSYNWPMGTYTGVERGIVEFGITWGTDIPTGATLLSAELNLYARWNYGIPPGLTDTFYVQRLVRLDWVEGTWQNPSTAGATWVDYKIVDGTHYQWTTAGAGHDGNDYTSTDQASIVINSLDYLYWGWMTWDVTNQVKWAQTNNTNIAFRIKKLSGNGYININITYSESGAMYLRPKLVITYAFPPTVTTQVATNVETTSCAGNGTITDTGGKNATRRGFCYVAGTSGDPTTADSVAYDDGDFIAEPYTKSITGLSSGTSYRVRAYAQNSTTVSYGSTVQILTKPAAPTTVSATDGTHTDKVVVTWTKSTGATDYQVYRDGTGLGWAGDVATYDDTGAGVPTITAGSSIASDGSSDSYVALNLSGTSANNGTTHTYKVRAKNGTGESADSDTNTGYIGVGALTYQWQRSTADSDAGYSNIAGATTVIYNDTGAPADGSGRYYKCVLDATGATQQTSTSDRGYRAVAPPAGSVTSVAASSITYNSAQLNAIAIGTFDSLYFYWGLSAGSLPNEETVTETTGAFSKVIGSLTVVTPYYFRGGGLIGATEYLGDILSFTTLQLYFTATLNGTLTDDGGGTGDCSVRFQYGLTTAYGTDTAWQTGKKSSDTFSQVVTGFIAGQTYHYRAQAKNSYCTVEGSDVSFTYP